MSRLATILGFGLLLSALAGGALVVDQAPAAAQAAGTTITGSVVATDLTPLAGVTVVLEREGQPSATTVTDRDGLFRFEGVGAGTYTMRATLPGYVELRRQVTVVAGRPALQVPLILARPNETGEVRSDRDLADSTASGVRAEEPAELERASNARLAGQVAAMPPGPSARPQSTAGQGRAGGSYVIMAPGFPSTIVSGEDYARIDAHRFHRTVDRPLSTFGADVDTASYANVRRFLANGQLPPPDAVRVEEFVNYFRFDYPAPTAGQPIGLTMEIAEAPWAPTHRLVLIGARAAAPRTREIAGRNLVLLVDVSGSMASDDKLPLLRSAFGLFVDSLEPDDRVAIVTYAGTSGVALPPTPVRDRGTIQRAIAGLGAGGSTNGAGGITTAYRLARQSFISGGVNRVMLATDGDFNVGITDQRDLLRLIERERDSGVFLSVFGVGTGNLKDSTMEMLADHGNGQYAYFDSLQEARRVLVREGGSTIETVAKDVKFQVEFNPARVAAWKQIGYENRALADRDFNDDRKDGGEMGAGHTVTVLYEIVPVGAHSEFTDARPDVDPLRYQATPDVRPVPDPADQAPFADEWLTVKARYKDPEADTSQLIARTLAGDATSGRHLPLASALAEFGLLLREDRPASPERWNALAGRARRAEAPEGFSAETRQFTELVEIARGLAALR